MQVTRVPRPRPLNITGVGHGSQVCLDDHQAPIAMKTKADNSGRSKVVPSKFDAPIVSDSDLPGILGLRSMTDRRTILDLTHDVLYHCGPGEFDLLTGQLPPGSEAFNLYRTSVGGHLMLPTDYYREARTQESGGGIEVDLMTLPINHQAEQQVGYPEMPIMQSPIDPPAGEQTLGVAMSINADQEINPNHHSDLIEARMVYQRMRRREQGRSRKCPPRAWPPPNASMSEEESPGSSSSSDACPLYHGEDKSDRTAKRRPQYYLLGNRPWWKYNPNAFIVKRMSETNLPQKCQNREHWLTLTTTCMKRNMAAMLLSIRVMCLLKAGKEQAPVLNHKTMIL